MARTLPRSTDAFVVFGITGDLAKVMTFNSLYRLEARGLLDCPIVGVAFDDWSDKDLREHARKAIETSSGKKPDPKVFNRLAKRLSYVQGDFSEADTYERVAAEIKGAAHSRLLSGDPAVALRDDDQGALRRRAHQERQGGGREAIRPRPRIRPGSRGGDPPVHPRGPALPDRPLPGPDGAGGDPLPALRQRDLRARLESQQHRLRADHDGRGLRRLGSRQLLRPGRRRPGRRGQPPDADRGRLRDGAARRAATHER